MSDILSKQELIDLSGYRSNKSQIRWLNKNRIPYILNGEGSPKVNRQALAYVMGAPIKDEQQFELDLTHKGYEQ